LEKIACIGNGDSHGNSIGNCMAIEALALSPSAEILEARDRKRDTKLLRIIERRIQPQDSYQDDYFKAKVHSYNIVNELIKQRESGE
ncbi:hypothetical protein, partial [Listeria monocytogenes]|uniref:hypothetical protein n=1 Tax=Listeria monocytogenes TaxID=1639 RepID=UPI002FDC6E53